MISPDTARLFYVSVEEVACNSALDARAKILLFRATLSELLKELTKDEPQLFSDLHSRLAYVFDKYQVPSQLQNELLSFRQLCKRARGKSETFDEQTVAGAIRAVSITVFHFSSLPTPAELLTLYERFPPLNYVQRKRRKREVIPFIRAEIVEIGSVETFGNQSKRAVFACLSEELGPIRIALWDRWSELSSLAWQFATLHFFQLQKISDDQQLYATGSDSLVILEPDFLVDATDLAECFQARGFNPNLYLLKKFTPTHSSEPIALGNIVNGLFDELIIDLESDFETAFLKALHQRPLALLPLVAVNPQLTEQLRERAREHFANLYQALSHLQYDTASIEPTFISARYGIQGRLDLLISYLDDERRKDVIELKSGSAPRNDLWRNHLAQTTCYNLLLDSAVEQRRGGSSILYSRSSEKPLRNAPNLAEHKRDLLALRNVIVHFEHKLSSRNFAVLRALAPGSFGVAPPYVDERLRAFTRAFKDLSSLERKYFFIFVSFIARELWSVKVGDDNGKGFAALWRQTIAEKEQSFSVLSYLRLDRERSDFESNHIRLQRTENAPSATNFRTGDIVLTYPLNDDESAHPLDNQILKGSLRSVTPEYVTISLRNKQMQREDFEKHDTWCIERDFLGTTYAAMHKSLSAFIAADVDKRALLLGQRRPRITPVQTPRYQYLTDEQNSLLQAAMSAADYYLLQGPPGTGKTSRMLRAMSDYLFTHSNTNIALLAYTNRAVDEICDALLAIEPRVDFVRLGSKENTRHSDHSFYERSKDASPEQAFAMMTDCRIIVSTIASLLTNPEILSLRNFNVAIIDEASQILEPQIVGLLSHFERWIMIGDEKQLPPVVAQQECGVTIIDDELNKAGIRDLRTSIFERLLELCHSNKWEDAYGGLTAQGRMHCDIQEFPNRAFYRNRLATLHTWQNDSAPGIERSALKHPLVEVMQNSRVLYLQSQPERRNRLHIGEAQAAATIASVLRNAYGTRFSASTLGIITPFRAQIATIIAHMDQELRSLVAVDTVERFQGSERDIILISFAANHPSHLRSIQSLNADGSVDRKLNVALTRARSYLIALGAESVLAQSPSLAAFIDFARERGGELEIDMLTEHTPVDPTL